RAHEGEIYATVHGRSHFRPAGRRRRAVPRVAAGADRAAAGADRGRRGAERLRPDAAVVDLHMPLLDGVTTVARLRRDHPSLCLIVLTGDADTELHRAAEGAGADAVLEKHEMARGLVDRLAATRPAA